MKALRLSLLLPVLLLLGTSLPLGIPPGTSLVSDNDAMRAFLISSRPISNFEYRVYQEWYRKILDKSPGAYAETLIPKDSGAIYFNDPSVQSPFDHPAYVDYPVAGVNWAQAMDYCSWRNDRYNERILASEDRIRWKETIDYRPDNVHFNTETYLNDYFFFAPSSKSFERARNKHRFFSGNSNRKNSSVGGNELMYGCRLPTEEEWDCFQRQGASASDPSRDPTMIEIAEFLGLPRANIKAYERLPSAKRNFSYYTWLLDNDSNRHYGFRSKKIMGQNKFTVLSETIFETWPKNRNSWDIVDSFFRFGFRIIDWNPGGEALLIVRPFYRRCLYAIHEVKPNEEMYDFIFKLYAQHSLDTNFTKTIKTDTFLYSGNYQTHKGQALRPGLHFLYKGTLYSTTIGLPPKFYGNRNAYSLTNKKMTDSIWLRENAVYTFNVLDSCYEEAKWRSEKRLIKYSSRRLLISELNGRSDLGFHIMIPYYGNLRGKKIKW